MKIKILIFLALITSTILSSLPASAKVITCPTPDQLVKKCNDKNHCRYEYESDLLTLVEKGFYPDNRIIAEPLRFISLNYSGQNALLESCVYGYIDAQEEVKEITLSSNKQHKVEKYTYIADWRYDNKLKLHTCNGNVQDCKLEVIN